MCGLPQRLTTAAMGLCRRGAVGSSSSSSSCCTNIAGPSSSVRSMSSASRIKVTYTSPIGPMYDSSTTHPQPSPTSPYGYPGKMDTTQFSKGTSSSSTPGHNDPRRFDWRDGTYSFRLGLGVGTITMLAFAVLTNTIKAEEAHGPNEDPTIICIVGLPGSGKSTQAKRLSDRFDGFKIVDGGRIDPTSFKAPASSIIIDGYPRTLTDAKTFESKSQTPIFVLVYFDMPEGEWSKRNQGQDSKLYNKTQEDITPLIKEFRRRGNILEISAEWDDPNEVWEQVEAKVEQVLELKARGENVAVE